MTATPMNYSAPPSLVTLTGTNTTTTIVSGRDTMPLGDIRQMLARYFSPNALKQLHRDQRDAAIRAVAEDYRNITKPTERAHEIRRRLALYAGGAWRFEKDRPPGEDPARARLHRVLALQGGKPPSFSTVWRALAGGVSPNGKAVK